MINRASSIRNLRTVRALRGDSLMIDLNVTGLVGEMSAWMKKSPNDSTYRSFEIVENRYLILSADKASDYYTDGELTEAIEGKWYFDVVFLEDGKPETNRKTIFTGTISFFNDITGSNGVEMVTPEDANCESEGGSSQSIYLTSQIEDLGDSTT